MNNSGFAFTPQETTISIIGCGWYGLAFAKSLIQKGFIVKGSTTSAEKLDMLASEHIRPYQADFSPGVLIYDPSLFLCDILWICIPPKSRHGEGGDYLQKIKLIAAEVIKHKIKNVVLISSTGVYGEAHEVNEFDEPVPETESGKVLLAAEIFLREQTLFTSTIIRFGGLVGPGRDPGRFFAGKKDIPNGRAPVNLIHLVDCIGLSNSIIERSAFGHIYNACSPDHPAKAQFYTMAAAKLGLVVPEFIDELKLWKIVSGSNTAKILNYTYKVGNWGNWLNNNLINS